MRFERKSQGLVRVQKSRKIIKAPINSPTNRNKTCPSVSPIIPPRGITSSINIYFCILPLVDLGWWAGLFVGTDPVAAVPTQATIGCAGSIVVVMAMCLGEIEAFLVAPVEPFRC
jgi:hypothetical protein